MFKQLSIASLMMLSVSSVSAEAPAWPDLTKENIGKGLGAITGAIIGSKIGGGHGTTAAIAVGTLAGYWAGGQIGAKLSEKDRKGIDQATSQAVSTGKTTTWKNPDTGTSTRISVKDVKSSTTATGKAPLEKLPPIELINAYYTPTNDINVRGGPGTEYSVLHSIRKGEAVPVAGKVLGSNWYLIAEQGKASGFLYAPLMNLSPTQPITSNAIREASAIAQPGRYTAQSNNCRIITQKVSLSSGSSESHQFKACQQANGNWAKI